MSQGNVVNLMNPLPASKQQDQNENVSGRKLSACMFFMKHLIGGKLAIHEFAFLFLA